MMCLLRVFFFCLYVRCSCSSIFILLLWVREKCLSWAVATTKNVQKIFFPMHLLLALSSMHSVHFILANTLWVCIGRGRTRFCRICIKSKCEKMRHIFRKIGQTWPPWMSNKHFIYLVDGNAMLDILSLFWIAWCNIFKIGKKVLIDADCNAE